MADDTRIEELRRRVRKDPASLAFAQLAEELRRARRFMEAVAVCRTGLEMYPGYLSARVTLGRCFIELDRLDDAEKEIQKVREVAPENLIAIHALAEVRERRSTSTAQAAWVRRPPSSGAPFPANSTRVVEGPDVTYDGATFGVRQEPGAPYEDAWPDVRLEPVPDARPSTSLSPTRGPASPGRAVEGPDAMYHREKPEATCGEDTVRVLAALEAWLEAIDVTRASRRA